MLLTANCLVVLSPLKHSLYFAFFYRLTSKVQRLFLRSLRSLKPLKPLSCLFCSFCNRRPRHSVAPPPNSEGDVVGRHRKVGMRADLPTTQNRQRLPLPASCSARPPSAISTTPPDHPFRRGGVLWGYFPNGLRLFPLSLGYLF